MTMKHTHHPRQLTRRQWLQRAGGSLAGAFGAATLGHLALGTQPAYAADYKALVCIFLYGGNDGMNMIVPTDSRYSQYSSVRKSLALPQSSLVPLAGSNFALHPSLSALQPFWTSHQLAPVFNVGPLYKPLTKAQYLDAPEGSEIIPDALFSHSDQQIEWETGTTDAMTRTGWGGRASKVLGTVNPVISVGGNGRFGVEDTRPSPLVLPGPGATFGAYGLGPDDTDWEPNRLRRQAIDALYAEPQPLVLGQAYAAQQTNAFEMSERLGAIVKSLPGDADSTPAIDSAFAPLIVDGKLSTSMGQQLYQIAKLIRSNAQVQGNRQIFFAQQGAYDTHSGQIGDNSLLGLHAALLKELGDAMACFQQALVNLGLAPKVTTFTQSDFGRTFAPNSTAGTDHAWGNHQLVIGGSVKGGDTYGKYPTLELGGPDDVGVESWELQGRWIPTSSVDQFASTMLGWFGAGDGQLDKILPNLVHFGAKRSLGFL